MMGHRAKGGGRAPGRVGRGRARARVALVVALALGVVSAFAPASAFAGDLGSMYARTGSDGVGAALWSGGSVVPGSPSAGAGCAPKVQQAHGAAYAAGMQNAMTISKSERQPPGKILTSCISTLISMLSSLDIFSNAGPWALKTIMDAVVSYAEQMVCTVIAEQFNKLVSVAFNSVAFLQDVVPCGVSISLTTLPNGAGGFDFCSSIGGPMVSVGSPGGTLYTSPRSSLIPPLVSQRVTGRAGNNMLSTLLGR